MIVFFLHLKVFLNTGVFNDIAGCQVGFGRTLIIVIPIGVPSITQHNGRSGDRIVVFYFNIRIQRSVSIIRSVYVIFHYFYYFHRFRVSNRFVGRGSIIGGCRYTHSIYND